MNEHVKDKIKYYTELMRFILMFNIAVITGIGSAIGSGAVNRMGILFAVFAGFFIFVSGIALAVLNTSIMGKIKKL